MAMNVARTTLDCAFTAPHKALKMTKIFSHFVAQSLLSISLNITKKIEFGLIFTHVCDLLLSVQ